MAISTAPRCEIRALVMHGYPDGITAYGHERHNVYVGRRGKPVRNLLSMPHVPCPWPAGREAAGPLWSHGGGGLRLGL
jgi:hypothetical protein